MRSYLWREKLELFHFRESRVDAKCRSAILTGAGEKEKGRHNRRPFSAETAIMMI
jgi:hypothetical protein